MYRECALLKRYGGPAGGGVSLNYRASLTLYSKTPAVKQTNMQNVLTYLYTCIDMYLACVYLINHVAHAAHGVYAYVCSMCVLGGGHRRSTRQKVPRLRPHTMRVQIASHKSYKYYVVPTYRVRTYHWLPLGARSMNTQPLL